MMQSHAALRENAIVWAKAMTTRVVPRIRKSAHSNGTRKARSGRRDPGGSPAAGAGSPALGNSADAPAVDRTAAIGRLDTDAGCSNADTGRYADTGCADADARPDAYAGSTNSDTWNRPHDAARWIAGTGAIDHSPGWRSLKQQSSKCQHERAGQQYPTSCVDHAFLQCIGTAAAVCRPELFTVLNPSILTAGTTDGC